MSAICNEMFRSNIFTIGSHFLSFSRLICQKAGKLQGLLPGDLGDVGKASLSNVDIEKLISLTVTETDIGKSRLGSDVTKSYSRTPNREESLEPTTLSRRHFELCARLLACAQRQYLVDAEWAAMEDPVNDYRESIPPDPDPEASFVDPFCLTVFETCSQSDFINSPWISLVGRHLWSFCDTVLSREASQLETAASQETAVSSSSFLQSDIQHFASVLRDMSNKMYEESARSPVPFLQLVCACAETFPMGQCFASNTQRNWHSVTSSDTGEKAYCNGCSPDDIALVISLVTNILEKVGGPNGNVQTQRWALICLVRLAGSSDLVATAAEQQGISSPILHVVWQRVWHTMFRTDLRYASYTGNSSKDNLGELVLILLTEITKRRCTDPLASGNEGISTAQSSIGDFVSANQEQLWNLEAFSSADSIDTQAVFDLINAVLHRAGLSEVGRDQIDDSGPLARLPPEVRRSVPSSTRRYRLVAFCLRYLERAASSLEADKNGIIEAASLCLVSLATGKWTYFLSTFDKATTASANIVGLRRHFCATNITVDKLERSNRGGTSSSFSSFLHCLWNSDVDALPKAWLLEDEMDNDQTQIIEFDDSELIISRELIDAGHQRVGDRHCDFVSPATASALHEYSSNVLMTLSESSPPDGYDEAEYEFDESVSNTLVSHTSLTSMIRHISYLKLLMSIAFSCPDDDTFKQADMLRVEGRINFILDEIVTSYPSTEQKDEHCNILLTKLYQVLQALSVISLSIGGASIPASISARLDDVFGMCRQMIREYSKSRGSRLPVDVSEEPTSRNIVFDSDDEDTNQKVQARVQNESDSDDSSGRKRKSDNSWSRNRTKKRRSLKGSVDHDDELYNCPSSSCANRLASILVLLQPSYGVCRMIAEAIALSRTGGIVLGVSSSSCDANVGGALHCLNLFCNPMVIHREQTEDLDSDGDELPDPDMSDTESGTIVTLCCDILRDIRSKEDRASRYYLFGFEVCSHLVNERENIGCAPLNKIESYKIVEILIPNDNSERKTLKKRPDLRTRQLAAATSVFENAGDRLHSELDDLFKPEVIAPNLLDISSSVRKHATYAVGAALRAFSAQARVVSFVKEKLPPLLPKDHSSASSVFHEWWASNGPRTGTSEDNEEDSPGWKDVFLSFQTFAVDANGMIVASATDRRLFRDSLFEMVLLASQRPDLEGICYHTCDKAARRIGFGTVQQMLMSEAEYLCTKWVETEKQLQEMPLLLTAPTVLLHLMLAGTAKSQFGRGPLEMSRKRAAEPKIDRSGALSEIRHAAAQDYIERVASFLLPIICRKNAIEASCEDYFEEIAILLGLEEQGIKRTKKLLKSHFHDILAVIEPLLHSVSEEDQREGEAMVAYVEKQLESEEYTYLRGKKARLAVHQLLANFGKGLGESDSHSSSKEVVQEAIIALAQEDTNKRTKAPFAAIGSSATEFILHARFWLAQSVLTRQKVQRWYAIDLVFSFVLKYIKQNGDRLGPLSQLGYCLKTACDILSDPALSCIYPAVLKTVNAFVSEVLRLKFPSSALEEISPVFYRLIGTFILIHERFQDVLIDKCLSSWIKQRRLRESSSGLRLSAKTSRNTIGDVWGWDSESGNTKEERTQHALVTERMKIDDCLYKTLIRTHEVLKSLFANIDVFRGNSAMPMKCLVNFSSGADAYAALSARDPDLCARSLVRGFFENEIAVAKTKCIARCVSTFVGVTKTLLDGSLGRHSREQNSHQAVHEIFPVSKMASERSLSIDFQLLHGELTYLQQSIESSTTISPMEYSSFIDVTQEERYSLVNILLNLCEPSYPKDIQEASSRCLGALGPCDVENLASVELELAGSDAELFQASQDDKIDLLTNIKYSCMKLLSQYLVSPNPETAIAALEAAKAILVKESECKSLMDKKNDDFKRLLDPIVSKQTPRPKSATFVAPPGYLESLLARVAAGEVDLSIDDNDPTWCWNEVLWTADRNGVLAYKDWVKFITCAMIHCCYVDDKDTREQVDRVLGTGMFFRYCIKLCALEDAFASKVFSGIVVDLLITGVQCGGRAFGKNLASQYLSKCFAALIGTKNRNATEKVGRPSTSTHSLSLVVDTIDMIRFIMQKRFDSSKHTRNSRRLKDQAKARERSNRLETPNGIVLHLNGLCVARACIEANRFASALFYADMHCDRCYDGGAGGILERLSNGEVDADVHERDISGFDDSERPASTDGMDLEPSKEGAFDGRLALPSILQQSYTALGDLDAAGAVSLESAAMRFLESGFKWNSSISLQFDTLERLKALDMQCQDHHGRIVAGPQVLDCMEKIGLDSVLQTYTTGLLASHGEGSFSRLTTLEQVNLRDRWFRGRLQSMQWEGEFFSDLLVQEPPQSHASFSGVLSSGVGFHEGLSKALSSFMKDDVEAFQRLLSRARGCLVQNLTRDRKGEAPLRGLVDSVEKLQFLNDVETLKDEESCRVLAKRWQSQNDIVVGDRAVESPVTTTAMPLRLSESGLWAREIMLRVFQEKESHSRLDMKEYLVSHLWQIGSIARLVGRSDLADATLQRLHTALNLKYDHSDDTLLRVRFEEAMIMESRGDFSSAIRSLKLLSRHLREQEANKGLELQSQALYADALLSCGELMNQYKAEPGKGIMNQYLKPSVDLAEAISKAHEGSHNTHRSFAAHLALAKLTSGLFESICRLFESPEWSKAGDNIAMKRAEIETCQEMRREAEAKHKSAKGKAKKVEEQKLHDLRAVLTRQERVLENMLKERTITEAFVPDVLGLALESYCKALCLASNAESSDVSTHVYRLVSLWFGNCDHRGRSSAVNEKIATMIVDIPSFHFVPLAYQIFARLASGPEEFQNILNDLIYTMCLEHPYHCLVQLLALSNGRKVGDQQGANAIKENVDATGKVDAALQIIGELEQKGSPVVRGLVGSYRQVLDAYIELALASTKNFTDKNQSKDIPLAAFGSVARGLSLKGCTFKPCVITKPPVINPGAFYGDGTEDPVGSELISSFASKLWITKKGRSKPKFVKCHGSSGTYQQVVKGNDDCRGDAVMQQVFCFVNNLMKRRKRDFNSAGNVRALKNELNIVTYHIVPLSPAAGVLEFVEDSIAFGDYLVDEGKKVGAHSKYKPGEYSWEVAKSMISEAKPGERRKVYDEICENFSPVFRHFFTERFGHSLPLWYASKMKYTRSCAVNSMVGHVLGIGDRHIFNILIHEKTGEVVHIDFGMVFEQALVSLRMR